MFGFNKKKKKQDLKQEVEPLSSEEVVEIQEKIERLAQQIKSSDSTDKPKLYENLGAMYVKLGKSDEAIEAYENSLKVKEQFGDAYNALLNLYEEKRKAAAIAKNDDEIQKWVTKTDALLDMSKRVLRSSMF